MEKIILIGGGGHAKVLIDLINSGRKYKIFGILDPAIKKDTSVSGVPVLGADDLLEDFCYKKIKNVCVAVGSIKDNNKRRFLCEKAGRLGYKLPSLIHPGAIVSESAKILEGAQIMAGAIIQADAVIGENSIINTAAVVEHDCVIGRDVHICPGAMLCGGCYIGEGVFVGSRATVIQRISIGRNSVIGAGAVVVKDVAENLTVMGIPAR